MLVLTNWWWPYSKASIVSALRIGYCVHVVVSTEDGGNLDWLWEMQADHPNRIQWEYDETPRRTKAAHTLTRFDYLPKVLRASPEPILPNLSLIHI